jgi:WD40 repeat protein
MSKYSRINHGDFHIGMKGGEAYEISLDTNSVSMLSECHGTGELHALGFNILNTDEYATGGDDGSLRVWSISKRCCVRKANLGSAIRALSWKPSGSLIVVGFGGDPKNSAKDGAFSVVNCNTLDVVFEDRKAKKWISDIKFGAEVFVLMSRDGCAYVHDSEKYTLVKKIELPTRNQSGITRGDISSNCEYIRLATTNQELFYYSLKGELVTSPMTIRNVEWKTHSCVYTWMAKGSFHILIILSFGILDSNLF